MSAFQIIRNSYWLLMVLLAAADYFWWQVPLWWYLVPSLLFLLILVLGSSIMSLNIFAKSHTQGSGEEKAIAFTFDDGPSAQHTPAVLDVLDQWNIKATFFCIGHKIEKEPALLQEIMARGHSIGNHSWSHSPFFSLFGWKRVREEMEKTNALIRKLSGQQCRLFRPPYGVMNPNIARAAAHCNLQLMGWSIRSYDTATPDAGQVVKRVLRKLKPGAVVLLHDDREHTAEILAQILAQCKAHQFRYFQVQELVK